MVLERARLALHDVLEHGASGKLDVAEAIALTICRARWPRSASASRRRDCGGTGAQLLAQLAVDRGQLALPASSTGRSWKRRLSRCRCGASFALAAWPICSTRPRTSFSRGEMGLGETAGRRTPPSSRAGRRCRSPLRPQLRTNTPPGFLGAYQPGFLEACGRPRQGPAGNPQNASPAPPRQLLAGRQLARENSSARARSAHARSELVCRRVIVGCGTGAAAATAAGIGGVDLADRRLSTISKKQLTLSTAPA